MNPAISVITVCRNARDDLLRTMASIKSQLCHDFEWIIVDGASDDGTVEILSGLTESWIYWISEPDDGIYDAMNKGLKKAQGKRVWFMNAGDTFFDENSLSLVADIQEEVDICFGESVVFDQAGRELGLRSDITPHKTPEELTFEQFHLGMVVSHQAFVPLLHIIPEYKTDKYKFSADLDWMLEILKKERTSVNMGILCKVQREGASLANWRKSQFERFQILSRNFGLLKTIVNHLYITLRRLVHGRTSGFWK